MIWVGLHPNFRARDLGYIPQFLNEADPRGAAAQIADSYIGGWSPFEGFKFNPETQTLTYPGDPVMRPLAGTTFHDEVLLFYPHAWFLILQKDGSYEIARLD